MRKHHEIFAKLPDPDEEFDFHGLRVIVHVTLNEGCQGCFFHRRIQEMFGREPDGNECDEEKLPLCENRSFTENGFNNEDEFKVWQVIKRMGLEDE